MLIVTHMYKSEGAETTRGKPDSPLKDGCKRSAAGSMPVQTKTVTRARLYHLWRKLQRTELSERGEVFPYDRVSADTVKTMTLRPLIMQLNSARFTDSSPSTKGRKTVEMRVKLINKSAGADQSQAWVQQPPPKSRFRAWRLKKRRAMCSTDGGEKNL